MSKNEKIFVISSAVASALFRYDADNVDIVKNAGMVDIIYHSANNSFPIAGSVCNIAELEESDIRKIADNYGIGYCW